MSKTSSKGSSRPKQIYMEKEKSDEEYEEDTEEEEEDENIEVQEDEDDISVGDFVEIHSHLWTKPYVAEVAGINSDNNCIKVEWYYRPEHITRDGRSQLVYDRNVKSHETITEFMEDEVLYAAHNEPEEISVDYVVQKCNVVFVKIAERNENMNGGVAHDLQTYYAPLHLAYDCNRSLVLRVNVDM